MKGKAFIRIAGVLVATWLLWQLIVVTWPGSIVVIIFVGGALLGNMLPVPKEE